MFCKYLKVIGECLEIMRQHERGRLRKVGPHYIKKIFKAKIRVFVNFKKPVCMYVKINGKIEKMSKHGQQFHMRYYRKY